MEYSIGEVAERYNLPISQLRYYDKEGIIPNIKRINGIRKFSEQDIETLFLIECLKQTGLTLKEIKQFVEWTKMGDSTIDLRLNFFKKQEEKVMKQIKDLEKSLKMIKYKCWYYDTAKTLGSVSELEANKDEITPENIKNLFDEAHDNF